MDCPELRLIVDNTSKPIKPTPVTAHPTEGLRDILGVFKANAKSCPNKL
jgi:hypothetical protein